MVKRNTGQTTTQMLLAPHAAIYVWVAINTIYAEQLAQHLNRQDLQIVTTNWLMNRRYLGLELTGVVMDHAIPITQPLLDEYLHAQARVRNRVIVRDQINNRLLAI